MERANPVCLQNCPCIKKGLKRNAQLEKTRDAVNTLIGGMLDREIDDSVRNQAIILVDELNAILEESSNNNLVGLKRSRNELDTLINLSLESDLTVDEQIKLTEQTKLAVTTALQELSLAGYTFLLPEAPSYQVERQGLGSTASGIAQDIEKNEERITRLAEKCQTGPQEYRRFKIGPKALRCGSSALKSYEFWQ